MTPEQLLQALEAQRRRSVEVEPGKKVFFLIPTDLEVAKHFIKVEGGERVFGADYAEVMRFACGWEGVTEADLIGPAGSSDAAPFSTALLSKFAENKIEWFRTISRALLEAIAEREKSRAADAKN